MISLKSKLSSSVRCTKGVEKRKTHLDREISSLFKKAGRFTFRFVLLTPRVVSKRHCELFSLIFLKDFVHIFIAV